jgi:hypothetical protein
MRRISSMKLVPFAAISAAALLGACAAMDRDTMFENNGPPPASAAPRAGQAQAAPTAPQARAATPAPQAEAATPAPQQEAQVAPSPAPAAAPTSFTDAQLQSFVTASRQIEPLNRQVATASPDQRAQLATQIRAILTQNNLDGATYNAIATRAQTDQALASRIAAIQTGASNG